jgi:YcxB-like protein
MSYSANESVHLTFRHDEKEFLAATRLYFWHRKELVVRFIVIDLLFAVLFLGLNVVTGSLMPLWAVVGLILLVWVGWFHGALIDLPRSRFRGDPKYRDEYNLTFTDANVQFRTENINATFAWNFYGGVIENDSFYLLTYGKNIHSPSIIPKRAFRDGNQETIFRRILRRNLAPDLKLNEGENPDAYVPKSLEPPNWR